MWAEKKPLCPEAENFIAGLKKTGAQKPGKGFSNLPCRYENGGIVYPVLSGKTLEDRIRDLVENEQTDEILRTLKHVYEHDVRTAEKRTGVPERKFLRKCLENIRARSIMNA